MILSSSSRVRVGSRSVLLKQIRLIIVDCVLNWNICQRWWWEHLGANLLNWPVISVFRFHQSGGFICFCLLGQLVHWETLINAIWNFSLEMPFCFLVWPTCDRVLSSLLPCFLTGRALVGGLHPSPRLLGRPPTPPPPPSSSFSFPHLFRSLFPPTYSRITFAFTFSA